MVTKLVFLRISQNSQEKACARAFYKKRLPHRWYPVKFAKVCYPAKFANV